MSDDNRDARREYRRKRRIRSQIVAYMVLILLIVIVGVGIYIGVKKIVDNKPAVVSENVASESVNSVTESQNAVAQAITTPDAGEIIEDDSTGDDSADVPAENERAREYVDAMSLEQKVANLFIVSPEAITGVEIATMAGDGTRNALSQYAVGGILYSTKNIQSADQFTELVSNTKTMYSELYNAPVWTVVEEGGLTSTIVDAGIGYTAQTPASQVTSSGDTYQAYLTMGNYLNDFGITMNIGPVCDVLTNESAYIAANCYGSDAASVAEMVEMAVNGQNDVGVISCLRTFPGEGELLVDTATQGGSTDRSLDDMRSNEFLPFIAGIDKGAEVVMISHISAPNVIGDDTPSSLSSVMIEDVLRNELGYNGVVITDRMDKTAITSRYTSGDAAVMAIQAGADMILAPADFYGSYQAVLDAVNNGTITEERIDESLMRIYSIKFAE